MKNLVLLALVGYFATSEMGVNALTIRSFEEPKAEEKAEGGDEKKAEKKEEKKSTKEEDEKKAESTIDEAAEAVKKDHEKNDGKSEH